MTRRQARKAAHRIAYLFLQQALDVGAVEHEHSDASEGDRQRINDALDAMTQRHFELGEAEGNRRR